MRTNHVLLLICLLFSLFLSSVVVVAEELNPEARESFEKGMIAVGQKEWPTAIRYFLKAQEKAPYAPEVLFNLGLAESKVPGRELRAIAWLRMYLEKAPSAANAEAVRKEIGGLEIRVEGVLENLVGQAKLVAARYPDEFERQLAYSMIAKSQAFAGDFAGAIKTLTNLGLVNQADTLSTIAVLQVEAGDIKGSSDTLAKITGGGADLEYSKVATAQAKYGAISAAQSTLARITKSSYKAESLLAIAAAQMRAGKKEEAYASLAMGAEMTRQREEEFGKRSLNLYNIADLQAQLGDLEGAAKTLSYMNNPGYSSYKEFVQKRINELRAKGVSPSTLDVSAPPDPDDRIRAWRVFLNYTLDKPLFTEYQVAIQAIGSKQKPDDIMYGMVNAITHIGQALTRSRQMGSPAKGGEK